MPPELGEWPLALEDDGPRAALPRRRCHGQGKRDIAEVLRRLVEQGIAFEGSDDRANRSLEDIFVDLVEEPQEVAA